MVVEVGKKTFVAASEAVWVETPGDVIDLEENQTVYKEVVLVFFWSRTLGCWIMTPHPGRRDISMAISLIQNKFDKLSQNEPKIFFFLQIGVTRSLCFILPTHFLRPRGKSDSHIIVRGVLSGAMFLQTQRDNFVSATHPPGGSANGATWRELG